MTRLLLLALVSVTIAVLASPAHAAVTSALRNGTLVLAGDDDSDALEIDGDGLGAGELRVTPEDGTMLDGAPTPQTFSGITADLRVALDGGDNHLSIWEALLPANLTITGRDGVDDVFVGSTNIDGDALVMLGDGDNRFLIADGSRVGGDLSYRGGSGNDDVGFVFTAYTIGSVKVALGDGDNSFSAGDAGIIAGGTLRVKGGHGPDVVAIRDDSSVGGDARIDLGDGANLMLLSVSGIL